MVKIKRAHESFVVLDDKLNPYPYYLKDRTRQVSPTSRQFNSKTSEVKTDIVIKQPFQHVDISRIRSPNIPFVGSNRSRRTPELKIDQNDDGYSSHEYKRGPSEKVGAVSDTGNISASSSTIPPKRFNDNYSYTKDQRTSGPNYSKQDYRESNTPNPRDNLPGKNFQFNHNNDESSCYFDYDYLSNSSEDVVQPPKITNKFENKKNSMVTFNTKIHKKGKSKESKLPNLMFDSDSDREGLLHEEDEYVYPDDKVKLIQKRNVRQDSKTNWKKSNHKEKEKKEHKGQRFTKRHEKPKLAELLSALNTKAHLKEENKDVKNPKKQINKKVEELFFNDIPTDEMLLTTDEETEESKELKDVQLVNTTKNVQPKAAPKKQASVDVIQKEELFSPKKKDLKKLKSLDLNIEEEIKKIDAEVIQNINAATDSKDDKKEKETNSNKSSEQKRQETEVCEVLPSPAQPPKPEVKFAKINIGDNSKKVEVKLQQSGAPKKSQDQAKKKVNEDNENENDDKRVSSAGSSSSSSSGAELYNPDVEFDNLDFQRDDQLASFCRERLNRITERTLNVLLLEMRKADRDRDMVLPPSTVDELIHKYKLPLTPCLPFLHKKFRDKRFIGSTNYEQVMKFLEDTRRERHKIGPEEIQDWKQELKDANKESWIRSGIKTGDHSTDNETKNETVSEEESKFIVDLQTFLIKKVIDIEMVANLLIEKDSSYTNQVPSREVEGVLKTVGVNLEKPLLDRMVKLAEVKKNHCSIQRIINLVKHGSNPVGEDGSKEETTDVGPDSSDNESDGSWKQMFQFRSSQPVRVRSKQGSNSTDASAKQKNIKKLKNAMVLSYHHNEGYLPPKEVANLSLAYSTVYHLGFDQGLIVSAVNDARSMDIRHGMVNVAKFIQYITENAE